MKQLIYLLILLIKNIVIVASITLNKNINKKISLINQKTIVKTLLIDNYDSYTYNLYHLLTKINGIEPYVIYNNQYNTIESLYEDLNDKSIEIDNIVLSPGPGSPLISKDFGISLNAIKQSNIPILGVCLGHQGIGYAFNGQVDRANEPMHGRISKLKHNNNNIFSNIPQDFNVVRYHSLIVQNPLPNTLRKTAWTNDNVIMGLEHINRPIYGVQFHPESICTEYGDQLIKNFKDITINYINKNSNEYGLIKPFRQLDENINSYKVNKRININMGKQIKKQLNTQLDIHIHNQFDNQIDKQVDKQIDRQIHIIKRKLNFFNLTIENIFTQLYSNKSISFWFDSTASHTYDYNNQTISILGSLDHSLSKSIECIEYNQIAIRNETACYNLSINIFEYIQQLIDREKDIKIDYTYDVIEQSGSLTNKQANYHSIDLPINLTSVLFGYLSYELRHLTTNLLDNNINRHNSRYNLTSRSIDSHSTKYTLDYPLALYLQPVRYLVYDHLTDDLFIISTQDSTMNNYTESTKSLADYLLDQIVELSNSKRNIYSTVNNSNSLSNYEINKPTANKRNNLPVLLADKTRTEYSNNINKCIEYIKQGETYEVCLTLQFKGSLKQSISSYDHYLSLRSGNRAPYSCYIRYDNKCNSDFAVLCSSPERFIKISQEGLIETKPIKGTAKRNLTNESEDQQIAFDLKNDIKSKSENLMIVDLLRNDLSRVCQINSINVTKLMDIETYSTVHQLVTTINGKLNKYNNLMDVLVSTFPGGSMTGAPKIRTLDIIDKLENRPRGIYSGAIGYIGLNGIVDKNIVIRTAVISDDVITIGSGGAIVILSDPAKEVDEVITKAEAVSRSLGYRLQFPEEL